MAANGAIGKCVGNSRNAVISHRLPRLPDYGADSTGTFLITERDWIQRDNYDWDIERHNSLLPDTSSPGPWRRPESTRKSTLSSGSGIDERQGINPSLQGVYK